MHFTYIFDEMTVISSKTGLVLLGKCVQLGVNKQVLLFHTRLKPISETEKSV